MAGDAAEALRQAGLALSTSGTTTALQAWQLLKEFGLDDEQQQLEEEITAEVAASLEKAEGEAGDRVKYKAAVKQMTNRWELFRLVHGIGAETEPTLHMVKEFCAFMYKTRQRNSTVGRQGLGDAVAKMAQHVLAQARARARSNRASSSRLGGGRSRAPSRESSPDARQDLN